MFVQQDLIFTVDQATGHWSVEYQDAAAVLGDAAFLAQEFVGQTSGILRELRHYFVQGEVPFEFSFGSISFSGLTQGGFFFVGHIVRHSGTLAGPAAEYAVHDFGLLPVWEVQIDVG